MVNLVELVDILAPFAYYVNRYLYFFSNKNQPDWLLMKIIYTITRMQVLTDTLPLAGDPPSGTKLRLRPSDLPIAKDRVP